MSLLTNVEAYFSAIRRRDRQAWLDTFSDLPELVHVDPVGAPGRTSKSEVAAFWDQIHSLFAKVSLEIRQVYPALPQQVALIWVGRGIGKNGVAVEFDGIDLFHGDDQGKILRLDAFWDANATLSKLMV